MTVMSAKDAKNNFGKLMEDAQREPVVITKHNRPSAVLVSAKEYREIKLEKLRSKLLVGERQADDGESIQYSFEQLITDLDSEK